MTEQLQAATGFLACYRIAELDVTEQLTLMTMHENPVEGMSWIKFELSGDYVCRKALKAEETANENP